MALPKKKTRKITVGETAYRWAVYETDDKKQLRVELLDQPASQLVATRWPEDAGFSATFTPDTVAAIVREALEQGWQPERSDPSRYKFEGTAYLKSIDTVKARGQLVCTVIAPLDHGGDRVRDTVARAVREVGLQVREPLDLERLRFSRTEEVIQSIIDSDLVVADISRQNPNVLYEVGYAHGMRKPTILIVEEAKDIKIPSALTGYMYLAYDASNLRSFKETLAKMVLRTVKQGLG